jgi:hypothetical protein
MQLTILFKERETFFRSVIPSEPLIKEIIYFKGKLIFKYTSIDLIYKSAYEAAVFCKEVGFYEIILEGDAKQVVDDVN